VARVRLEVAGDDVAPGVVLDAQLLRRPARCPDSRDHPEEHLVVSARAVGHSAYRSRDGGRRWRPIALRETGLLAWPRPDRLFRVDRDGQVKHSGDAGSSRQDAGSLEGPPAAIGIGAPGELLAALHDGTSGSHVTTAAAGS
jgi:hypothetical protein